MHNCSYTYIYGGYAWLATYWPGMSGIPASYWIVPGTYREDE